MCSPSNKAFSSGAQLLGDGVHAVGPTMLFDRGHKPLSVRALLALFSRCRDALVRLELHAPAASQLCAASLTGCASCCSCMFRCWVLASLLTSYMYLRVCVVGCWAWLVSLSLRLGGGSVSVSSPPHTHLQHSYDGRSTLLLRSQGFILFYSIRPRHIIPGVFFSLYCLPCPHICTHLHLCCFCLQYQGHQCQPPDRQNKEHRSHVAIQTGSLRVLTIRTRAFDGFGGGGGGKSPVHTQK